MDYLFHFSKPKTSLFYIYGKENYIEMKWFEKLQSADLPVVYFDHRFTFKVNFFFVNLPLAMYFLSKEYSFSYVLILHKMSTHTI